MPKQQRAAGAHVVAKVLGSRRALRRCGCGLLRLWPGRGGITSSVGRTETARHGKHRAADHYYHHHQNDDDSVSVKNAHQRARPAARQAGFADNCGHTSLCMAGAPGSATPAPAMNTAPPNPEYTHARTRADACAHACAHARARTHTHAHTPLPPMPPSRPPHLEPLQQVSRAHEPRAERRRVHMRRRRVCQAAALAAYRRPVLMVVQGGGTDGQPALPHQSQGRVQSGLVGVPCG